VIQIKALGFDLGGVVLASEQEKFYGYAAVALGVPVDNMKSSVWKFQPELERGNIQIEQFWQNVTADLGVAYDLQLDVPLWRSHYVEDSIINSQVLKWCDDFRKRGYRVGLLSNTHEEHIQLNQNRGIFEHFDTCLFSSRIHTRKPETEAYQALWQALGVEQQQLVFVDDRPENVAAAKTLGIQAIEYTNNQELFDNFKQLGVLA